MLLKVGHLRGSRYVPLDLQTRQVIFQSISLCGSLSGCTSTSMHLVDIVNEWITLSSVTSRYNCVQLAVRNPVWYESSGQESNSHCSNWAGDFSHSGFQNGFHEIRMATHGYELRISTSWKPACAQLVPQTRKLISLSFPCVAAHVVMLGCDDDVIDRILRR